MWSTAKDLHTTIFLFYTKPKKKKLTWLRSLSVEQIRSGLGFQLQKEHKN